MREALSIGIGLAGLAIGFFLGRARRSPHRATSHDVTISLLKQLAAAKGRMESRLNAMEQAMDQEKQFAIERKQVGDRKGSMSCLARKRDLKKEVYRVQGLITSLYCHIIRLESRETLEEVSLREAENEMLRVLQIEDIEGEIVNYRIENFLSLMPRARTSRGPQVLSRSFTT